jgi:hypothetical protein
VFLVLLSRQIYLPSSALLSKPSLYTLYLVQKTPRRDVLTILCSLLNTVINSSQPNAISIGSMAGKLPYNHFVFKGEDPRSTLVSICFQVLCVLLDFQSGTARDVVTISGENQSSAPTPRTNAFRYFLAKLVHFSDFLAFRKLTLFQHRTQDFAFIVDGIIGIFELQLASMNNLLPGARKSLPYVTETGEFDPHWYQLPLMRCLSHILLENYRIKQGLYFQR